MSAFNLDDLRSLLQHICLYAELSSVEIKREWRAWLPSLSDADWLRPQSDGKYIGSNTFLTLSLLASTDTRLLHICFSTPTYRHYLLTILAQGLVSAGQVAGAEYRQRVCLWVTKDLPHLAGELNHLLDEVEGHTGRLVDRSPAETAAIFAARHQKHESFAEWDRALLGLSGSPEQLFTAVLNQAAAFQRPHPYPANASPLALLPPFDLTVDGNGKLNLPPPAPWTRARQQFHSSLPFYDSHDHPLFDTSQPVLTIWQDALAQQPYYRACLRLLIAAHFSDYGGLPITLLAADDWAETAVQVGQQPRGRLSDLLPGMVSALGYQPLTPVTAGDVRRILTHWQKVAVVGLADGRLALNESYARTLHERRRARLLLRGPARAEQEQLETFLKSQ